MKINPLALAAASSLAFLSAPAAQATTTTGNTTIDPAVTTPVVDADRDLDDHDFPWGLLGIIGLAGLLGRKRDDVHVDRTNRTDTNNRM